MGKDDGLNQWCLMQKMLIEKLEKIRKKTSKSDDAEKPPNLKGETSTTNVEGKQTKSKEPAKLANTKQTKSKGETSKTDNKVKDTTSKGETSTTNNEGKQNK